MCWPTRVAPVRRPADRRRARPRRGGGDDRPFRAGHDDRPARGRRPRRRDVAVRRSRSSSSPTDDSWFRDTGPIYVLSADGDASASPSTGSSTRGVGSTRRGSATPPSPGVGARTPVTRCAPCRWSSRAARSPSTATARWSRRRSACCTPTATRTSPGREIEDRLRTELGVDVIVWLPHGLALDDDTDGHVDNVAAFARPGVLVLQGCADEVEADRLRADVNRRSAAGTSDADGRADRGGRGAGPAVRRGRRARASASRTSTTTSATGSSSSRSAGTTPTTTWWR